MSMLDDLYKPDYKSRLTTQIVGRPGSGKSYYLRETITEFMKRNSDPNYRLVFLCPKHEMILSDKKENHADIQILNQKKEFGSFLAIMDMLKEGISGDSEKLRRPELEIEVDDTLELIEAGLEPDFEAKITLEAHNLAKEKSN